MIRCFFINAKFVLSFKLKKFAFKNKFHDVAKHCQTPSFKIQSTKLKPFFPFIIFLMPIVQISFVYL